MDAELVASAFGLGAGARLSDGAVARGRLGEVWRLHTERGTYAVKVPFAPPDDGEVRRTTRVHEAAVAAGVPTPRVIRATDGEVFADVGGHSVRIYEWVDLLPPDPHLDPALVGAAVAATHRVPGVGVLGESDSSWYVAPIGRARWDGLIERLWSARAPFAEQLAALRDELVALDAWVVPPRRLLTCHRDLWADNVRATPGGGVCLFDWENAGPADPTYELACVVFEYARDDADRARTLVEAYTDAGGPGRLTGRGDFSMLIAQLGHITHHAAHGWLAAADADARAEAAAWVAELVDDPHTRDRLTDLLDAVPGR